MRGTSPEAATRRGFVGGLLVMGAARTLAAPAVSTAVTKSPPCTPKAPGIRTTGLAIAPDHRTAWTTDNAATTITAHRGAKLARHKSIDVGGAPVDIVLTRDGHFAVVTTAYYDRPGLAVVNLRTGHVARYKVGPEPSNVAHRWHKAWVTGGGSAGTLTGVSLRTGHVHAPIALGLHPRGVAVDAHNRHALVALNGESAVALVTLATGAVRRIPTPPLPYDVALSPDGAHALVTHNGFDDHTITPIDVVAGRARRTVSVGRQPVGVAYTPSGRHAVVALMGAHELAVVDGRTGHRHRTVKHLHSPAAVAVAGRHAIVADWVTGELKRVRV